MAHTYTFSSSIKPLYYFCRIFGLAPVSIDKSNGVEAQRFFWKIYSVIVLLSVVTFGTFAIIERFGEAELLTTALVGEVIVMLFGAIKAITAIFLCSTVNSVKFRKLTSIVIKLDSLVLNNDQEVYKKTFSLTLVQIILLCTYLLTLFTFDIFVWNISMNKMSIWCLLTGYPHRIVNLACVLQYCDLVLLLKSRLNALNRILNSTLGCNTSSISTVSQLHMSKLFLPVESSQMKAISRKLDIVNNIHTLRNLYDELCDVNTLINSIHGPQLLIELVLSGIELTLALYFLLSTILGIQKVEVSIFVALQVLWIVHHSYKLISVTAPCQSVNNAYDETVTLVQKLLLKRLDDESVTQLQIFSFQLFQRKIKLTVFYFLTIDYSVLFTILGAVTTYLVFALQYK